MSIDKTFPLLEQNQTACNSQGGVLCRWAFRGVPAVAVGDMVTRMYL